ncbi:SANT/Myb_domain [Hexamita inflata]|uniref:SANT/Myb domain n=1 Tax=Hexamita inflata TaxID=28002 RepID=A0AA86Q5F7_9EUKA|nr:SANT/Myb domain [Hexamita inflata]
MDMFNLQLQQMSLTLEIQEVQNQINARHKQEVIQENTIIYPYKYIQRARWSYEEDQELLELVKQFGISSYAAIYQNMKHKYKDQIYFRIRYLRNQFRLNRDRCTMNRQWFEFFVNNRE